jgi:hypothetical protein
VGSKLKGDESRCFRDQLGHSLILCVAEQEIQGLEALEHEMSRNVYNLRRQVDNARFTQTLKGRIYFLGGKAFAVYCYFRVCSVSRSI